LLKQWIKKRVRRKAQRWLAWANDFFYDANKNGEFWILKVVENLSFKTMFDVGANVGTWAMQAHKTHTKAAIHCFELTDTIFAQLQQNLGQKDFVLNEFGLSNEQSEISFKDYGEGSESNTLLTNAVFHDAYLPTTIKKGLVKTGDAYCDEKQIEFIDFLKIDVEGAEHLVLEGFSQKLSQGSIRLIQFEYGYTHGDAKFLMRDFYQLLEHYGYRVGKLRPNKVDFCEWSYPLNDFDSGPNFIAIKADDDELFNLLTS
jgi:FkbM family methyltransferase